MHVHYIKDLTLLVRPHVYHRVRLKVRVCIWQDRLEANRSELLVLHVGDLRFAHVCLDAVSLRPVRVEVAKSRG